MCPPGTESDEYWIPGNYAGDLAFEPAWFNACDATWVIDGMEPFTFGIGADSSPPYEWDVPLLMDVDGDETHEIAVHRVTDGTFHVRGVGQIADLPVGIPVPADWDGDGDDDPAVYRTTDGTWHIDGFSEPLPAVVTHDTYHWPIPADYSGGISATERAVVDTATGTWFVDGQAPSTDPAAADVGDFGPQLPGATTDAVIQSFIRLTFAEECDVWPEDC